MITVLARMRVESAAQFRKAHDDHIERRQSLGCLSHVAYEQLDDVTDVVFVDSWSSPQDADNYYHSDGFDQDMRGMGGSLIELIKLEEAPVRQIG